VLEFSWEGGIRKGNIDSKSRIPEAIKSTDRPAAFLNAQHRPSRHTLLKIPGKSSNDTRLNMLALSVTFSDIAQDRT